MKPVANNNSGNANVCFSLGAAVVEDDIGGTSGQSKSVDQDYWGSSMSLHAVQEGRIFGVFGVARNPSLNNNRLAGAVV